jgi:predicted GIY-YIG superfamily endonuclease
MPDYSLTVMYRIVCKDKAITDCYIGQTTNYPRRVIAHKSSARCGSNEYVYRTIRRHGGVENWEIIFLEDFPCTDRFEALAREKHLIETYNATLNTIHKPEEEEEEMKRFVEETLQTCSDRAIVQSHCPPSLNQIKAAFKILYGRPPSHSFKECLERVLGVMSKEPQRISGTKLRSVYKYFKFKS